MKAALRIAAVIALAFAAAAFSASAQPNVGDRERATGTAKPEKKPQGPEITALIKEYFGAETSSARKSEIIARLGKATPGGVRSGLTKYVRVEDTRAGALQLCLDMKLEGSDKDFDDFLNSPLQAKVLDLCFAVASAHESPLCDGVTRLWMESALDSDAFKAVQERLTTVKLPRAASIKKVKKSTLKKLPKDRNEQLAAVLKFQLDLKGDNSVEILEAARAHFGLDDASHDKFQKSGGKAMELKYWNTEGEVAIEGKNVMLSPGASLNLKEVPKEWQEGSFNIRARVMVVEGDEHFVSLQLSSGAWTVQVKDGMWQIQTSSGSVSQRKVKYGQWTEIRFGITDNSNTNTRKNRLINIWVDGQQLMDWQGEADGDFTGAEIYAGSGDLIFGGGSAK